MKTILITGASGLVGRAVVERLKEEEVFVYAATSDPAQLPISHSHLKVIDNREIKELLSKADIDILLHLAFPRNAENNQWANGIQFALNVLFLAKEFNVKRVINVSSQSIYGLQRNGIADETSEISLFSTYTAGKYCSEVVTENLFEQGSFCNIRLSTIIGPTTEERVTNKFFAQIAEKKDLVIKGGNQSFSFLDVRDAADGLVQVIKCDKKWLPIYNLGTTEVNSLLSIAKMCVETASERYGTVSINVVEDNAVLNNGIDVSLFNSFFNWKANHSLRDSLEYILMNRSQVK